MTRIAGLVALLFAALSVACGSDSSATKTPSPPARTPTPIVRTASPSRIATVVPPAPSVTIAPAASATPCARPGCTTETSTPAPIPTCGAPADCTQGTLEGHVLIGPTCPVQRIDSPCPNRPFEAEIEIINAHDKITVVHSGVDGRFVVQLAPGGYTIVAHSGSTPPTAPAPQFVTIIAGETLSVTLTYDSGIR